MFRRAQSTTQRGGRARVVLAGAVVQAIGLRGGLERVEGGECHSPHTLSAKTIAKTSRPGKSASKPNITATYHDEPSLKLC